MKEQKNAHKAAGNLLISANYLSRGTSGGLKGFVSACERSKIEAVTFCSAESKTNKEGENGTRRMTAHRGAGGDSESIKT